MALSEELKQKLQYYEQAYFYTDEPVPFKDNLKVYPVMAKDYYKFYSNLSCLTMDKTTKKAKVKNELGQEVEKMVSNPQGISMSYMAYLIEQMTNPEYGALITQQVINILSLCLHEEQGLFCPECGKKICGEELIIKLKAFDEEIKSQEAEFQKQMKEQEEQFWKKETELEVDMGEPEKEVRLKILNAIKDRQAEAHKAQMSVKRMQLWQQMQICEDCQGQMREIFSIKNGGPIKKLCVYNTEFSPKEFDELIAIITHQNILDYTGDRYVDPDLKKDLDKKAELENKNYSSPSLEKQLICVAVSSSYNLEELKNTVTLRKLAYMLKVIDSKNVYYAQLQGQMSGMVTFKTDPVHWIFGNNSKDISKEIMTLNDIQSKFAAVT